MLRPLQAALARTEHGWRLELSPMRAIDALLALAETTQDAPIVNLVKARAAAGESTSTTLADLVRRLGISTLNVFGDDLVAVNDESAHALVALSTLPRIDVVRIAGPVEPRDAKAIVEALDRGDSPLGVELRATAVLRVRNDRAVRVECRDRSDVVSVVAEDFRHYVAAVLRCAIDRIGRPETWQLERLLSVTGRITVRPLETEIYSTSVDVGISTGPIDKVEPANRSLIYDRPSDSWHDEP